MDDNDWCESRRKPGYLIHADCVCYVRKVDATSHQCQPTADEDAQDEARELEENLGLHS